MAVAPIMDVGLSCRDVCVVRGGNTVLNGVSIDFDPGSVNVLRGPNGAGKTSLLRVLSGIVPPKSGAVVLNSKSTAAISLMEATLLIGHLNGLKPSMTVKETISFWTQLYGQALDETTLIDNLDLTTIYERRTGTLSAGQKRRVAIARAVLSKRPIWLLDEPTNSLDDKTTEKIEAQIDQHRKQGGIAIIATHDPISLNAVRSLTLESAAP